jgi:fatty acid desaturase
MLLIFFKGAFSEKFISGKELGVSFLEIIFLMIFYSAWILGKISFSEWDWPLLLIFLVVAVLCCVWKRIKFVLSTDVRKRSP